MKTMETLDQSSPVDTPETQETPETGAPQEKTFDHSATYSPEDNKLRIYPAYRLPRAEYETIKSAGFKWAPKQELFVCPRWTPQAEDAALDLCGDIGDEEQPAAERAAERAERFDGYRENRLGEALDAASRFDSTGWRIAHARRQSNRRREQARSRGVSRWECAEYWRHRVSGVLSNSEYKDRADVRHRRIQGLESDRRKMLADYKERQDEWDRFANILRNWATWEKTEEEFSTAVHAALGRMSGLDHYDYPRPAGSKKMPSSLYSLTDPDQAPEDKIDGLTALCLWFQRHPTRPDETKSRWLDHYNLRIDFERALLAAQGGTAAQNLADTLTPGAIVGTSGKFVVYRVTKTKAGDLSRISLLDTDKGNVCHFSAERFKWADAVKPATDESKAKLAAFCAKLKQSKPKTPPLVNLSKEDAAAVLACPEWKNLSSSYQVREMTSAEYAALPSWAKDVEGFDLGGQRSYLPHVCRLRFVHRYGPLGIVVLTDKPTKPMPFDLVADLKQARQIARAVHSHCFGTCEVLTMAREVAGVLVRSHSDACAALREYARKTWPAAFGVSHETVADGADGEETADTADTAETVETLETEEANS
jgi:hypothetical protein